MRRRKQFGALAVGLVLLATGVLYVLWWQTDPITLKNYHRVRAGMVLAEVEAILGPRNVKDEDLDPDTLGDHVEAERWEEPHELIGRRECCWQGRSGTILVEFDQSGCAILKAWRSRPGLVEQLRHQWERWCQRADR
jgi:hypothetical protein